MTLHIYYFMLIDYAWIAMLLLVGYMSTHDHLLYFSRFWAASASKIDNKNMQQKTLPGSITIPSINYGGSKAIAWLYSEIDNYLSGGLYDLPILRKCLSLWSLYVISLLVVISWWIRVYSCDVAIIKVRQIYQWII